jgi:hypothetical protein
MQSCGIWSSIDAMGGMHVAGHYQHDETYAYADVGDTRIVLRYDDEWTLSMRKLSRGPGRSETWRSTNIVRLLDILFTDPLT